MPSENALPILMFFVGSGLAAGVLLLFGLGVAVSYLIRQRIGWIGTLVCAATVVSAVVAVWVAIQFATLDEEDRLRRLNLAGVFASYERMRAVYGLADRALPVPLSEQIAAHLETQDRALNELESSIWAIRRVSARDEKRLLFNLRSNASDLSVLQTRLEIALSSVECQTDATTGDEFWTRKLIEAWQHYALMLSVLGEQFAGVDFSSEEIGYVSNNYKYLKTLAGVVLAVGGVLLLGGAVIAVRRRTVTRSELTITASGVSVAVAALTLFGFAGSGSAELLERSFSEARSAHEDAMSLRATLLSAQQEQSASAATVGLAQLRREHRAYFDEVHRLGGWLRVWDEVVAFDKPSIYLIELDATISRDELPDRVRAQLVKTYRAFAFLGARLSAFHCLDVEKEDADRLDPYRKIWAGPVPLHHPLQEMMALK